MRFTWTLLILVALGLVAAFCAALLVTTIQVQATRRANQIVPMEMEIIVAKDSINAWSALEADDLSRAKVSRLQVPKGHFVDEELVIGRRVKSDVKEGQAITESLFPREGTGLQLASNLPEGMRAVSVGLKGEPGLEGLIYPGCIVDVLATFNLGSQNALGEAVSTTLLENIRVLAVENMAVGEDFEAKEDAPAPRVSPNRAPSVTLLVDAKQAEALQLAVDRGTVSLALRNPVDSKTGDAIGTLLNQGIIADAADLLDALVESQETPTGGDVSADAQADKEVNAQEPGGAQTEPNEKPEPRWTVQVFRGVLRETRELQLKALR